MSQQQRQSESQSVATKSHQPGAEVAHNDTGAPAPLRRTLILTGLAITCSTLLTAGVASPNRERFTGSLSANKHVVRAPIAGEIQTEHIRPGSIVTPGVELFRIVDRSADERRTALEAELQTLRHGLSSAKALAQVETSKSQDVLKEQVFQAEDQLAGYEAEKYLESVRAKAWGDRSSLMDALASTKLDRLDLRPLSQDIMDPSFHIEAILKEAEAQNRVEALQARIELTDSRVRELRSRINELPQQHEIAAKVPQLEAQIEAVSAAIAALEPESESNVVAPVYGMAGNVSRAPMSRVTAGDVLVEIFDRDHEFVNAKIPAKHAADLRPGAKVKIYFPNDVSREGVVENVPPQTTSQENGEAAVEVRIQPTGKVWPFLPIGSTLHVSLN